MANSTYPLPDYLRSAVPNPAGNRAPWYKTTAPSYAGIFLWIAFYDQLAGGTLSQGGIAAAITGIVLAAVISVLFYLAPAMWGMKTGYPLYIIGTSTFGDKGGYFLPGLFMGALQVGWYSVGTYFATDLVLKAVLGPEAAPAAGSIGFIIVGAIWGYLFAIAGMKGIHIVGAISTFFPIVPFLLLIYAVMYHAGSIGDFDVANFTAEPSSTLGTLVAIQIVIGFFATAGAAGADFGMNNRDKNDVIMGGVVGVGFFIIFSGIMPILAIAGAMAANPELANAEAGAWTFTQTIQTMTGGRFMYLLLAIASMAPACFCTFIIANSFSTMIPSISRMTWAMIGATIGIILAVTGMAGNLAPFFGLIGACFGPVCGAMAADYILCGGQWPGPRKGINLAGYLAVVIGFVVGILPMLNGFGISAPTYEPAAVYAFVVGFVLYIVLAKMGMQPEAISMPAPAADAEEGGTAAAPVAEA